MYPRILRDLRIVGVEDGGFSRNRAQRNEALLVAVNMLGGIWIYEVGVERINVDGLDATDKLVSILKNWEFNVVMLAGISYAGFNLIDPRIVHRRYGVPVLVVTRRKPNNVAVKNALREHFEDWQVRWKIFEGLGLIYKVSPLIGEPPVYVEVVGAKPEWACRLVRDSAVLCRVPEPLRVARLIAKGLTLT